MGSLISSSNYQLMFLLLLFLFHSLATCSSSPAQLCRNEESIALLRFKQLFSINASSSSNCYPKVIHWKDGTDCCAWDGVDCDNVTSHVIGLDLSWSCLHGTFHSISNAEYLYQCRGSWPLPFIEASVQVPSDVWHSMFQLPKLQMLSLRGNRGLGGIIPSFNGTSQLRWLDLSSTGFTGELPSSIGQLKSLKMLDLSQCDFSSSIPRSVGNLTQLTHLDLSFNHFSGKVPSFLSDLENLLHLDLSFNEFEGQIPTQLFIKLANLEILLLRGNSLSGQLPYSFSNLSHLHLLDLSDNRLTGPIPSSITDLSNLEFLRLFSNSFNGTIPSSLFNLVRLRYLCLSSNNLSGTIDLDMFANLENLECLFLSSNNFSSTIKLDMFAKIKKLKYLDLSDSGISLITTDSITSTFHNFITLRLSSCNISKIPAFLESQKELELLYLSNNKLNEELNPLICNLRSLKFLDLSSNQISGLIPDCLGNFSENLLVLNLHGNYFHGSIPQTFGYTSMLQTLDISHNRLQGALPRSLTNCTSLQVLNLGHNLIADVFPFWLENLPGLQVVVLRDNRFHGPIDQPRKRSPFANLSIIDLSHNDFTGTLPSKYFESWDSMMMVDEEESQLKYMGENRVYYFDSVEIVIKGVEISFERILTIFKAVDFSHNKFHGEISTSIGRLKLLRVLNLSGNGFTGHIPLSLANLTKLESLDLSRNKLSGEIPQQLTSLTFLAALDVSENNLTGSIPRGRQFETFSSTSYGGNPGLCGFPLLEKCGNVKVAQSPSQSSNNFNFIADGFGWRAVVMGYGCGIVLGLVIGSCIIRRKEEWFVRIFAVKMHR